MIFDKKFLPAVAISLILALSLIVQPSTSYAAFDSGRIIDDVVFQDFNSMSAAQVDAFLNSFPTSCISTNRGFQTPEPTGWSSSVTTNHGYTFGGMVSAGTAISRAAAIYNVSPKVILATLQKEQSLVTGGAGCYYDTPSTSASFPCDLYNNGTTYSCTNACPHSGGCVTIAIGMGCPYNCDASYNGFSIQLIAGTWLLRFAQQRAYGNLTGYTGYDTTDENTHYSGAMTQGYRKRSASSALTYYDGTYTPKDSPTITIQNGSTASLYYFTPFINGNKSFYDRFTDWFGSTQTNIAYAWLYAGQLAHTNATRTRSQTSVPTVAPGQKLYLTVRAKNNGFQTWDPSTVRLGTKNDKPSIFADSSWLSANRPVALKESSVRSTDIGSFEFAITAPNAAGTHTEYFNLVADGSTWLNDLGLYFTINVVTPSTDALPANTLLASGSELKPGEFISSPEGHSILSMQKDGNLVLYENFVPVWDTKTPGKSVKSLNMQTDGNLVLYDINNSVLWNSGTQNNTGARLAVQTDGNLVVYNAASTQALWNINRSHEPNHVNYVNTHLPVGLMYPGQVLETADRKYKLVLQTDGNLVLYSAGRAIWNSGTVGRPVALAVMQSDGNLVLYDTNYRPVWDTKTFGRGRASLFVQHDGNLVIYDNDLRPIWNTGTNGL